MSKIAVDHDTLGLALRQDSRNLRVPQNQRSYAWREEHVTELLKDITSAYRERREEYFLGSIVVVKHSDYTEIFDGQQRLATALIWVASIRDRLLEIDEVTAGDIEHRYLHSRDLDTHAIIPRIRLNIEDCDFFERCILQRPTVDSRLNAKPTRDSHSRIKAAQELTRKHVQDMLNTITVDSQKKELLNLLSYLERSACVIWVEVTDEAEAFMIFETMNDRGLQLSSADLLKNYLFSKVGNSRSDIATYWASMQAKIDCGDDDDDDDRSLGDFLRYHWIVRHGHTRAKSLFGAIKLTIHNERQAIDFSRTLANSASQYSLLLNPSTNGELSIDAEVVRDLNALKLLRVTQIRPIIMAWMERKGFTDFKQLIAYCLACSVRCLISNVLSRTLEDYYAKAAQEIWHNRVTTVCGLAKHLNPSMPSDDTFRTWFQQAKSSNARVARYYLREMQIFENRRQGRDYIPDDVVSVNLEHVMPSRMSKNWDHVSEEDHIEFRNRIGNFALLQSTANSVLGDSNFEAKKNAYKTSNLSLTSMIAAYNHWGPQEIADRQNRLAKAAVKTWRLSVPH